MDSNPHSDDESQQMQQQRQQSSSFHHHHHNNNLQLQRRGLGSLTTALSTSFLQNQYQQHGDDDIDDDDGADNDGPHQLSSSLSTISTPTSQVEPMPIPPPPITITTTTTAPSQLSPIANNPHSPQQSQQSQQPQQPQQPHFTSPSHPTTQQFQFQEHQQQQLHPTSHFNNSTTLALAIPHLVTATSPTAPTSLHKTFSNLSTTSTTSSQNDVNLKPQLIDPTEHLTCLLCYELFLDPISLECGHVFCRSCCLRLFTNSNKRCPICRAFIQLDIHSMNTNYVITTLIQHYWPKAYQIRLDNSEIMHRKRPHRERYGIFITDYPFYPLKPTTLLIFEPRYRILMNSISNSHHNFLCMSQPQAQRSIRSLPPIVPPPLLIGIEKRQKQPWFKN
jgi:hypothetical protein